MSKHRRNSRRAVALAALALATLAPAGAPAAPLVTTYAYDALGRLTSVVYGDSVSVAYAYDSGGNLLAVSVGPAVVGVEEESPGSGLPAAVALGPARPNPARGSAVFRYELPRESRVTLSVFDASGRRVRAIVDGRRGAGAHVARWDGRDEDGRRVTSGVYFFRLAAGGVVRHGRIALVH